MSCGVGRRCSSDLVLPWLWRRLAAIAFIKPLAWEPPYAAGTDLQNKTKQNKTKDETKVIVLIFCIIDMTGGRGGRKERGRERGEKE